MAQEEPRTNRRHLESVAHESADILSDRVAWVKETFPEAISEDKVDFDRLRTALGDVVDGQRERYGLNWAGKRDCIQLLQTTSKGTLVPVLEESVDFENSGNVFIEGENLEVLKLLYKSYFGRVRMIYIDPPYNTGQDFIYSDDYADPLDAYLKLTEQRDAEGNLLTSNPESSGRYHSRWLSMMYSRLFVARQLLTDDGVIFVSIDDHEVHNLRMIMNEVFGEENFVATAIWQKMYAPKSSAKHFSEDHDYILIYAKAAESWTATLLPRTDEQDSVYKNPDDDPRGLWRPNNLAARNYYSKGTYAIDCPGGRHIPGPPKGSYWRVSEPKLWAMHREGRIWWGTDGNNVPAPKIYLSEVLQGRVPQTLWFYSDVGHTQEAKKELLEFVHYEDTDNVLDSVKPTRLIQRMLQIATSPTGGDIVLDFFAGSGTTGHAVLKQNRTDGANRRYVCVQLQEPLPHPEQRLKTLSDVAKERLRNAGSHATKKRAGNQAPLDIAPEHDPGFRVFRLTNSNYRPWDSAEATEPEAYSSQLELNIDPLIEGWNTEDVIWEVALKEGWGLDSRIEPVADVRDNIVHRVTSADGTRSFLICLDDHLELAALRPLGLGQEDLFICRDCALTDESGANLALQCRLKTI